MLYFIERLFDINNRRKNWNCQEVCNPTCLVGRCLENDKKVFNSNAERISQFDSNVYARRANTLFDFCNRTPRHAGLFCKFALRNSKPLTVFSNSVLQFLPPFYTVQKIYSVEKCRMSDIRHLLTRHRICDIIIIYAGKLRLSKLDIKIPPSGWHQKAGRTAGRPSKISLKNIIHD